MRKKLLITVGGTGGHVYPALAVAKELSDVEILFAGGKLKANRFFDHSQYPCVEFASANHPKKAYLILKGIWQSQKLIRSFQPDLILGFGSFYTFPMLLAAKLTGTPFILHEANSIPGKVNRLMSRYARVTGTHFPETALNGKIHVVGMPVRFQKGSKEKACEYYGLDPDVFTLLIFGGSQGAQAINTLFLKALPFLPKEIQIIHLTGNKEVSYPCKGIVKPFEKNMAMAWQAADLMISRAGASTIAEQMACGVPGILIPYPYATDQHQDKNADFMVNTVGGAIKYRQKDLTGEKLANCVNMFVENRELLQQKRENIHAYYANRENESLATLIRKNLA